MSAANDPNQKIVHRYDDIEEEDNQMPNWWLFILFGTMVFMFGYWIVYHTTHQLQDPRTEYNAEVAEIKKARLAQTPLSDEAILAVMADPAQVAEGKAVYASTCCGGSWSEPGKFMRFRREDRNGLADIGFSEGRRPQA